MKFSNKDARIWNVVKNAGKTGFQAIYDEIMAERKLGYKKSGRADGIVISEK